MKIDKFKIEKLLLTRSNPKLNWAELFIWRRIFYNDCTELEIKIMGINADYENGYWFETSPHKIRGAREALAFIHDERNSAWINNMIDELQRLQNKP